MAEQGSLKACVRGSNPRIPSMPRRSGDRPRGSTFGVRVYPNPFQGRIGIHAVREIRGSPAHQAPVARRQEQASLKGRVAGSNPARGAIF